MLQFGAVFVAILAVTYAQTRGTALLKGNEGIEGKINLTQTSEGLVLEGHVSGLTPGKHGFHIHLEGNVSQGCRSTGDHFNPGQLDHGAPQDAERHAGDLGNIVADEHGVANIYIVDKNISLADKNIVLGKVIVVHSGEDDLGRGENAASKVNGNAGERIVCGVIQSGAGGLVSGHLDLFLGLLMSLIWVFKVHP